MKFSHTLQFNAVPEWIDYYVAYDHLKKIIFQLEKEYVESNTYQHPNDLEKRPSKSEGEGNKVFLEAVDLQLEKVFDFYTQKEQELFAKIDEVEQTVRHTEQTTSPLEQLDSTLHLDKTAGASKETQQRHMQRRASFESRLSTRTNDGEMETMLDQRSQLISLYVSLSELESYVELNRSAFDKIMKKHDKVLDGDLRQQYQNKMVLETRPFMPQTMEGLRQQIQRVEHLYADAFCGGSVNVAIRQMKTHLRDQITYDRNTVWREMVGQERKALSAHVKEEVKSYKFFGIDFTTSLIRNIIFFLFAIAALIALLNVDIFQSTPKNYCFAVLIFAAIMWATECVPLYATSLLLPFLIVLTGVMCNDDGTPMPAKAASKAVFSSMFSDTIMMLLGGFSLAGALSKYGIAKAFASHVLSRAGTRPRWVLLAIMFVAGFLCMWISNVATPVLCFSLIDPIMRTLPDNSQVAPCLLLGIALACCIGGMASPISSPQNIITIQYMSPNPGWGIWFGAALPISIISLFFCWGLLLLVYRPDRDTPHLNRIKPTRGSVNRTQVFVMFITIATIALWCAETAMEAHVGSTGVIAAIPLFMFFGTGILKKDDLHAFLWSVVVLAQGGMALGAAVTSSGLLEDIALRIKDGIQDLDAIAILAIFSFLILVFATFVSHTVAALIIVPIVQQVGQSLPDPRANLLVMGAGLACSAGMGLPVSGYPNMSAVMMESPSGKPYLSSKHFLITGVPTSIFVTVLVFTLGYGILSGVGY